MFFIEKRLEMGLVRRNRVLFIENAVIVAGPKRLRKNALMFECALYGTSKEKFQWKGEKFNRIEKTYRSSNKRAVLYLEKDKKRFVQIVFYEQPDRNKQRISIASKRTSVEFAGDCDQLVSEMGYTHVSTNNVEGYKYNRNGYTIEISRFKRKEEIVDSSEEEDVVQNETPEILFENYLVKLYVLTESINEGEQIINTAFQDLNDSIKLFKPDLGLF